LIQYANPFCFYPSFSLCLIQYANPFSFYPSFPLCWTQYVNPLCDSSFFPSFPFLCAWLTKLAINEWSLNAQKDT
jgi:hypothetical protein